jgi:hypothetical protein
MHANIRPLRVSHKYIEIHTYIRRLELIGLKLIIGAKYLILVQLSG